MAKKNKQSKSEVGDKKVIERDIVGSKKDIIPNAMTKEDLVNNMGLSYENIYDILNIKETKVIDINKKSEFIKKLIGKTVEMIKTDLEIYINANLVEVADDFFDDTMDLDDFDNYNYEDENDDDFDENEDELNNVGIQPTYRITEDGKLVLPKHRNATYITEIDYVKEIIYKGIKYIFV